MSCKFSLLHNYSCSWQQKQLTLFPSIYSNFDISNTDGSFTLDDSNSFSSPYEIFPITQENKY